jgi:hypothetical protein
VQKPCVNQMTRIRCQFGGRQIAYSLVYIAKRADSTVLKWRVRMGSEASPHSDAVAPIGFGRIERLICLLQ